MKDETENSTTETIIPVSKKPFPQFSTHTIENENGTKLVVSNVGAAVVSFFVKDKAGNFSDIVLGYENLADYLQDEFYIGTVVGRNANRIGSERVFIDGHSYKISVKNGGYHHHGGTTGFNKKIFSAETFRQDDKSGIVFKYKSPHLEEGFPGELSLEVKYSLDKNDAWTIEYKAISSQTTLINLTQHTYFNLSGDPSKGVDEHDLKILSYYYLPVNKLQLPTGELANVSGTAFDFTKFKKIGNDIEHNNAQLKLTNGYDHSFVLEKQHTPILKHAAVVKEPNSGRRMDVYTTEPSVHFYTGNFLENVKGKNGVIYNERAGFCLETQHFPDAPNHPHFPSTVLQAGEQFNSKTVFKLSVYA
ncbi:MAG: galactose mutarotase [Gloeobacteraceae cyanobacterium ES-bin-316]|nr:galactose mutarotase [Ferruginibacter sp.]